MKIVYYGPPVNDESSEGGTLIRFPMPVTARDLFDLIGDPTQDGTP